MKAYALIIQCAAQDGRIHFNLCQGGAEPVPTQTRSYFIGLERHVITRLHNKIRQNAAPCPKLVKMPFADKLLTFAPRGQCLLCHGLADKPEYGGDNQKKYYRTGQQPAPPSEGALHRVFSFFL